MNRKYLSRTFIGLLAFSSAAQAAQYSESILYSLGTQSLDGHYPDGGFIVGADGNYYGETTRGGYYNNGTIFSISPGGSYSEIFGFGTLNIGGDGSTPGSLVLGHDGNLYGTAIDGGNEGYGVIFQEQPAASSFNVIHTFSGGSSNDEASPNSLCAASDGNLYGTADGGGSQGNGTVFKISYSGTFTTLYRFGTQSGDGAYPQYLIQGSDGNFYGVTNGGGAHSLGTVFKVTSQGALTTLYSFGTQSNDGEYPSSLVQGSDGYFYGTTSQGGANNEGVVFKISGTGTLTVLHSFGASSADGKNPSAALIEGADGNYYGTTQSGGSYNGGTVFEITSAGIVSTLYSFGAVTNDGTGPVTPLIEGAGGVFYGTTSMGGAYGYGTAFKLTPGS